MKSKFLHRLTTGIFIAFAGYGHSSAQLPALEWMKGMGGRLAEYGFAITTDSHGNVYTAGIHQPDSVIIQVNGQPFKMASAGSDDAFITKQDANGNFIWATSYGGSGSDYAKAIAVDDEGSIYVTGYFTQTTDLNPAAPGTEVHTAVKIGKRFTSNFYLSKFDNAGNFQWARVFGKSGDEQGTGVVFDSATGTILVTGDFSETVDLGFGNSAPILLTADGQMDAFVMKMDKAGNTIWAGRLGGTENEWATGVATDALGNVYLTGNYTGEGDYDPDPSNEFRLGYSGSWDFYVCKLDASGKFMWAKGFGDYSEDLAHAIALDPAGNVHLTGIYRATVNFNPSGSYELTAHGDGFGNGGDIFILKLTTDGDFAWAGSVGSATADDDAYGITVDKQGSAFITGYFQGLQADFNPGTAAEDTFYFDAYKGSSDAYILKLNKDGKFNWAMHMGDGAVGYGITNRNGYIYATGMFVDSADFDPAAVPGVSKLHSNGTLDAYILKLIDCMYITDTAIYGPQLICNHEETIYHINPVPGATSYTWTLPDDWTGAGSLNQIPVTPGSAGTTGTIRVKAEGLCGVVSASLDIRISDPDPVIDADESILRVTEEFMSYQWYKNGVKVELETSRTFIVEENGLYQVEVTDRMGCRDTSATYRVNNLSAGNISGDNGRVSVYPVPADDIIYLSGNVPMHLTLAAADGRVLRHSAGPVLSLPMSGLPQGIYFLYVTDGQGVRVHGTRILKR